MFSELKIQLRNELYFFELSEVGVEADYIPIATLSPPE